MNILVIAPTPYFSDRGCHIRILEEAKALQTLGHTPTIYTYHLGRTPRAIPVVRSARVAWYKKTAAGPTWFKPVLDVLLLWKILRTTRRGQFQIIHAHLHEGGVIGLVARWWLRCPLVLDLQSELVNELRSYGWLKHGGGLVRWFETWLVRRANWVVVSSDRAAAEIVALVPDCERKLTLLRDGVSAVPMATAHAAISTPTIIYAGGMGPAKGFDQLLDALGELKRRRLNFAVLCIGKASLAQKQRAAHLGLHTDMTWRDAVPYEVLLRVLGLGTIGVDPKPPTSTEGSGKVLNYMAAGLAVVAYDSPTTRALVGDAGVLVTEADPTALANAIAKLLNNEEQRAHLAQTGQARIQKQFLWNNLIQPLVNVYDRLAQPQ